MSFTEAVDYWSQRVPQGSPWRTREWNRVAPAVRAKTYFSAGVEDMRFLQHSRNLLDNFLTQEREVINGQSTLKVSGQQEFVRQMLQFQEDIGMTGETTKPGRLDLIFRTQTDQAWGFGQWKQQMSPELLDSFPAAMFVRNPGSLEERPRHSAGEGEIRLWTDWEFWADFQNDPLIGGFSVPFAPFGFNSSMAQEPVDRRTAEKLGLLKKDAPVPGLGKINEITPLTNTKASVEGVDGDIRDQLLEYLAQKKALSERTRTTEFIAREQAHLAKMDTMSDALDRARRRGHTTRLPDMVKAIQEERASFDPAHSGDPFDFRLFDGFLWLLAGIGLGLELTEEEEELEEVI